MAIRQRKVTPSPTGEPKRKRKPSIPWSNLISRTGISRKTSLSEMPLVLTPVEAAAWLGLGRDGAYQFARQYGKRVAGRLHVPRRILERLAEGGT